MLTLDRSTLAPTTKITLSYWTLVDTDPETGDLVYSGPLRLGYQLAQQHRVIRYTRRRDGRWAVRLLDDPLNPFSTREWGNGDTLTEALRFALGALFGPVTDRAQEWDLALALEAQR